VPSFVLKTKFADPNPPCQSYSCRSYSCRSYSPVRFQIMLNFLMIICEMINSDFFVMILRRCCYLTKKKTTRVIFKPKCLVSVLSKHRQQYIAGEAYELHRNNERHNIESSKLMFRITSCYYPAHYIEGGSKRSGTSCTLWSEYFFFVGKQVSISPTFFAQHFRTKVSS
jgi:hypothetical protein